LFPAISFVVGCGLGPQTSVGFGLFLIGASFLGLVAWLGHRRTGAHLAVLGAFFLAGMGLSRWEAFCQVPEGAVGVPLRVEGTLEDVSSFQNGEHVSLAVSHLPGFPRSPVRFRVNLSVKDETGLEPGQRVQVQTQLVPYGPPQNPGQPDSSAPHLRRARPFHGGVDGRKVVVLSPPGHGWHWLSQTRQKLASAVKRVAPDPDSAALYLTLSAGLRAELGDDVEERFARSGLAHVLSVSGLHVAALALLCLKLLRYGAVRLGVVGRGHDARRWVAPVCVPLIWAYVVFTGNQAPAVRSAVMATLVLLGMALWRQADALNSLAIAALVLATWDPAAPADLSLQLSFLAVLSLALLTPALREGLPVAKPDPQASGRLGFRWQKVREAALQTFCASAAATLGGLPVVASTFHRISLAGLFSNIVCLPLCGLLTGLSAGGAATFVMWPGAATPLLFLGAWASKLLLSCATVFAAIPGAALPVPSMGPWSTALFYAGLLLFALGEGRSRLGGLLAPLAALCAWGPAFLPHPGLSVTFLSVGHGDAIVLSSAGHHALIDGGGLPNGADPGKRVVLPFLRESGITRLDLAVLSHPHPDHALGLVSTLAAVPTAHLWLAAETSDGPLSRQVRASAQGARMEEVEAGHPSFQLGEAVMEVLGPPKDRILLEGVNDRSIVLRVTHGEVSFLLTGDIEEAGEAVLEASAVTVLKAPHHGSRTSSTPDFVRRVHPRFVIFCVGESNRFHFPSTEVVDRYVQAGARCLRTDVNGAVRFLSDGHDVQVETFRRSP